ncbi:zinc-dependent alcohol dehydrogenase [Paenibacillus piri]|uniref:Alcohol dehydrogenase n=1 Tax=Paenibacillus piri TaxID=2547395 RepID=A0A4R5KT69_9BACL|nr:alcohol dehydrogenase catalytic domain-containing protein [Paenibacillus piri]TDF98846.1 alcohol dehydrogenase [Paenibacillus piri]
MLQAKFTGNETFVLEDAAIPEPGDNQVLLKVELCGICGSDMHTYHGKHPFVFPPLVMGHEFSGVIVKLGKATGSKYQVGQRVAVEPSIVCGTCYNCRKGRYNICDELSVVGCLTDGAYTEYIAVSAEKIIVLNDKLSFEDGAMLEPLSVGVHALDQGRVKQGDKILVIGAGTIGLLLAQAAKAAGAEVAIADVIPFRLELAKELGIPCTVNSKTEALKERLKQFAPDGVDVIFECVGSSHTIRQAIEIARKGIRIVILGVVDNEVLLPVSLIQDRELELVGDLMFIRKDFEKSQELIVSGQVNVKRLQTKTFPLRQVKEAFEFIIHNKESALKVFLDPK